MILRLCSWWLLAWALTNGMKNCVVASNSLILLLPMQEDTRILSFSTYINPDTVLEPTVVHVPCFLGYVPPGAHI